MGNCNFRADNYDSIEEMSKNHFAPHQVVGKGGFGKVWSVTMRKTKKSYAMKEMSKALVITKRSVNSVMNERKLLSFIKHPFIVNMQYAFQDKENLYLVMDMMTGGDLRYHLARQKTFTEAQTKFFVACIISGLEYLHVNGILHRDIKPENLVLDGRGYLRITDFGIARMWAAENKQDTSGTPGYMAPEVMCRQNHGIGVDYYAIGVMVYEFMTGKRPYLGRTRKDIREAILARQVQLRRFEIPEGWSLESADFVNKLLQRKPANRLGLNGPAELKSHGWLRNFDFQKLYEKTMESPYKPNNGDNFSSNIQLKFEDSEAMKQNTMLLKQNSVQELFAGYAFDIERAVNVSQNTTQPSSQNSSVHKIK